MRKKAGFLLAAAFTAGVCLTGCTGQEQTDFHPAREIQKENTDSGETLAYEHSLELQYAENFQVDYFEGGYALINIIDGSRYLVVPEGKTVPANLEEDLVVLRQPLSDIYLAATSAMGLFDALDSLDAITLTSLDADGWYIENAKKAMEEGRIQFAGKYREPDYERILSKGCSLAIESTMINHTPEVKEKLEETGIPVLTEWSSYESHPLGRTEWMKLYAVLLGKEELADRLFTRQTEYVNQAAEGENTGKSVAFFYISSSGYAVARKSGDYVTKMIELAGGNYIFKNLGDPEKATSTVTLEMEEFYSTAKEADYLIYNGTIDGGISSREELIEKNGLLKDFKAVKDRNVWCTNRNLFQDTTQTGLMIAEIHRILTEEKPEGLAFFYPLQ